MPVRFWLPAQNETNRRWDKHSLKETLASPWSSYHKRSFKWPKVFCSGPCSAVHGNRWWGTNHLEKPEKWFHWSGCRIMAITPAFQAGDVSSILTIRSTNDERVVKQVSWGNTARIPQQIGRRKVSERQWRIGNSSGPQSQLEYEGTIPIVLFVPQYGKKFGRLISKWGCGVVVTRCKTVNLLRFHTAYKFASEAWTRGSIPLIPTKLWCSSEAEQGAVNSQVGISEFPITAKTMVFPIQRMSTIQNGIGIQHPQPGPRENSEEAVKIGTRRVSHHCFIWPVSLSVRTHPFHGWETSSILVRATLEV